MIVDWVALAGVAAVVLTAIAGLTKAIADLIGAWRRPSRTPAPDVGIPAAPTATDDDIDFRAYADQRERAERAEARAEKAERDRDMWMRRALGIDEDTHPL